MTHSRWSRPQILLLTKSYDDVPMLLSIEDHSNSATAKRTPVEQIHQQLIKDLTLEYNKLRQANITKELLEITTAQMALG